MAIFHFNIQPIKRSSGQQATGAAAYRAGESIRDERSGKVHNFSRRTDVRHSEIVLPSGLEESSVAWARDRARLWNSAEAAEKRRDARVAREFEAALPPELSPERRLALARTFSRELADRYGVAVDLAIHDPKPGRESTNYHAHFLTTTREVTPTGLGAKAGLDMNTVARAQKGLASHNEEYSTLRERWAALTNQALREANIEARVDHRSLAAQGIDRKPLVHIPMEFYQLERSGMPKEAAERLREEYRARINAYRDRTANPDAAEASRQRAEPLATGASEPQRTPESQRTLGPQRAPEPQPVPAPQTTSGPQRASEPKDPQRPRPAPEPNGQLPARDSEVIRRRAVQAWLRMRSKEGESSNDDNKTAATARDLDEERGR
jgi:hypothetical protein